MREVFSDYALVGRYAEVEIALAKAEAKCGVIPAEAAEAIAQQDRRLARSISICSRQETDNVGYPILPLVHQMVEAMRRGRPLRALGRDHAGHHGHRRRPAAARRLEASSRTTSRAARASSPICRSSYRDTPMAGRTHLQQALPVTFGYKTAIWLAMFDRHAERLAQLKPRVLVGQFAGAAGTLASLGDKGFEVQQALCEELGLGVPVSTWHVARDGFAEAVNLLALVTGSLGKIATDIMIMASTEFAEVYEPFVKGRGASSTMPQKRNPISSELMLAAAKAVRQHAGLMLDAIDPGFRARHRPVACRMDRDPRKFRADRGRPASGQIRARRPHRRRGADGEKPRHQPGPDRRRSRDDGPGAAARPAGGA